MPGEIWLDLAERLDARGRRRASCVESSRGKADSSDTLPGVTALETVLILAVIPAALFVLITLAVMWPRITHPRYRAGSEWNFAPVLWVAHPAEVNSAVPTEAVTLESDAAESTPSTARGGARGNW